MQSLNNIILFQLYIVTESNFVLSFINIDYIESHIEKKPVVDVMY